MSSRYNYGSLKTAIQHPRLFGIEGHRIASKPFDRVYGAYSQRKLGDGIDVMERDWDNLLILDACRYDYFKSQNHIDGDLTSVVSRGYKTAHFIAENFAGRELHDTIYVTANPHFNNLPNDTFYRVRSVLDEWDTETGTILPEDVVKAAREESREHPNKRLLVHFMQPHRPHIGPTADRLRNRVGFKSFDTPGESEAVDGMWWANKKGKITLSELRQSYAESLDIVLEHAETLVNDLSGKSVITADHGELLGERIYGVSNRKYGHQGPDCRQLRVVPWLEIDAEERRTVTNDSPTDSDTDDDNLNERLEALGYK